MRYFVLTYICTQGNFSITVALNWQHFEVCDIIVSTLCTEKHIKTWQFTLYEIVIHY